MPQQKIDVSACEPLDLALDIIARDLASPMEVYAILIANATDPQCEQTMRDKHFFAMGYLLSLAHIAKTGLLSQGDVN